MERILAAARMRVLSINEAVWIFAVAVLRTLADRSSGARIPGPLRAFRGPERTGADRAPAHLASVQTPAVELHASADRVPGNGARREGATWPARRQTTLCNVSVLMHCGRAVRAFPCKRAIGHGRSFGEPAKFD